MKRLLFTLLVMTAIVNAVLALNHSGTISSNQIWYASDNPHVITGDVTVNNGITLLIQAGCEVYFNGNFRLLINGTMNASGSVGSPIIFTSNQAIPAKGDWRSIYFNNADAGSTLDYCQISYGGSDFALVGVYQSSTNVIITNCTFSNSESYGFRLADNTAQPSLSNCSFSNCDNYPIYTFGDRVKNITGVNTFTGNNPNAIRVDAQTITTGTWSDQGVPYVLWASMSVGNTNILTINPGTQINFNSGVRLTISGAIVAIGTSLNHIIFTSNQAVPAAGDWDNIYLNSADAGSTLEYCDITYGGGTNAAIHINQSASNVIINNCLITHSLTYGIYQQSNSESSISDCTIENCNNYAIRTFANRVRSLWGTMTCSGNGADAVLVETQTIQTGTWRNIGIPYVIWADVAVANLTTLTINPGTVIKFNANARLRVYGKLIAVGDAMNRIVFTSNQATPTAGYWERILFDIADPGSIMEYCDITYGGGTEGAIDIYNASSNVTINNCFISNSGTYGIYNRSTSTSTISNCTIQNCTKYAIRTYGDRVKGINGTMTFSGNNMDAILVEAQAITTGTWQNVGFPYVMWADMDVSNANTLTINPGTVLKFNSNARLGILGALSAAGNPGNHIVFTSNQAVPTNGYWERIYFNGADAGSIMDYCDVTYGGGTNAGIDIINSGTNVTISNCLISNSSSYGIFNQSTSSTSISNCSIQNCGSYAIRTYGDKVKYITGSNLISGNTFDAIRVEAQTISGGTWMNHNVPYILWADMDQTNGTTLSIDPGTQVKFNTGARLRIYGTLIANGNASNHIVFTSAQTSPTPGYWERLLFDGADAGTVLNYCDVSYGGGTTANIDIYNSGTNVTITNSTIKFSSTDGIYIRTNSSPTIKNSTITQNLSEGIYIETANSATFGSNASEWNEIYNNAGYELRNGTLNINAKYIYWGSVDCGDVAAYIYDKKDLNSLGLVNYVPWIDNGHGASSLATTWTGNNNTVWSDNSNWTDFSPCEMMNVTVPKLPANQPVVTSAETCNNLTLEGGSKLTVQTGSTLSVKGDLLIEANANGTASLVETGNLTVTGNTSAQFYITSNRWHYVSPPVSNSTANVFYDMYLYSHQELTNTWFNIVLPDTSLYTGQGYKVWSYSSFPGTKSVTFDEGTLNTGTKFLPVTRTGSGWNLVGNPYPSAIDWDHISWIKTQIDATVYVWNGTQYLTWNGSVGSLTDGVVPAMQAFMVKATGTSPYLVVNNNARLHGVSPYKESEVENLLELTVTGNGYTDKTFVNFNKNASAQFDSEFDGYKLFGVDEAPQIFTYIGDEILSINTLPENTPDLVVNTGLKVGFESKCSIQVSGLSSFNDEADIYLEDLKSGAMINMRAQNEYTFMASPLDNESRFRLHFKGLTVQGLAEQPAVLENNALTIYANDNHLYIRNNTEQLLEGTVNVYTVMGQLILSRRLDNTRLNSITLFEEPGYYIARVLTETGTYSQKIFIK